MKVILLALVVIIVIGIGSNFALQNAGFGAGERQAGDAVRID